MLWIVAWKPQRFLEGPGSVHRVIAFVLFLICSMEGKWGDKGFGIVSNRFWNSVFYETFKQGIHWGVNQIVFKKMNH